MIPNTKDRQLKSSGVEQAGEFAISHKDTAHIMTILRSTLYEDKILAVLREYSSNAWDAHRAAGKAETPIKVTLPTEMDPVLRIRDFGKGLSPKDIFEVFTQYGSSTKRGGNNEVGMLGIGSKSAFAYTDMFTITSWHASEKAIYTAVLDKTQRGVMNQIHTEPCGPEETGVEIQVAVNPDDIWSFEEKAKKFYQYFQPNPDINSELLKPPEAEMNLKNGIIYNLGSNHSGWVAVMGCVAYRINTQQVSGPKAPDGGVPDFVHRISGALYFGIGDVDVAASRENLQYTDLTKASLVTRFNDLVDEYVTHVLTEIDSGKYKPWEKRLKAQMIGQMKLPIPPEYKDLVQGSIDISDLKWEHLELKRDETEIKSIAVDESSRFIYRDEEKRGLKGYHLGYRDYLVRKLKKTTKWGDVHAELEKAIKAKGLEGIQVVNLSTLNWTSSRRNAVGRMNNAKHRTRVFEYYPHAGYHSRPLSQYWEDIDADPTDKDVFVTIQDFESKEFKFFEMYQEDDKIAKALGLKMPKVYGYKSTEKKPVEDDDCVGIEYRKWRETFYKGLFTEDIKKDVQKWRWTNILTGAHYWESRVHEFGGLKVIIRELGENHLISEFLERVISAKGYAKSKGGQWTEAMAALSKRYRIQVGDFEAEKHIEAIKKKYPLMEATEVSIAALWGKHSQAWIHYIIATDLTE